MSCERFVDFAMTRHWLPLTGPLVNEDIVSAAMPEQNATGGQKLAHQFVPFHRAMSLISN